MNNNKKLNIFYYYDVGSANLSECTFTVRKLLLYLTVIAILLSITKFHLTVILYCYILYILLSDLYGFYCCNASYYIYIVNCQK